MSFSAPEGAENTDDDELSSSDFHSSSDCNHSSVDEEIPLQEDVHQANLIAIHLTEKKKKGEGELKYIKVNDKEISIEEEEDDDCDSDNIDFEKKKKRKKYQKHKISDKHRLVMFPLGSTYPQNDSFILIAFMASMMFLFILLIVIPIFNEIVNTLTIILFGFALLCAIIGIFLDSTFYLAFNYETKQIFVQQQQCVGNCIVGNKGIQGKLLGDFENYKGVKKVEILDRIGECKKQRWQFIVTFKSKEFGEECTWLFTSDDEDRIDYLENEINEWWQKYNAHKLKGYH